MSISLNANEARVIGCLMEKSVTTPDQYPLTLNALNNACNQKSSRDPVMNLSPGEVQHTIRQLEAETLVRIEENFKSRTEKYTQRFCNSRYSELQFDPAEYAILCLMLLRGPHTPGEIRSRSGRLHTFADNDEAVDALRGLMEREPEPLVVKLPRAPGRRDAEYMHLFCGPVDVDEYAIESEANREARQAPRSNVAELEERVARLEAEVAELNRTLRGED